MALPHVLAHRVRRLLKRLLWNSRSNCTLTSRLKQALRECTTGPLFTTVIWRNAYALDNSHQSLCKTDTCTVTRPQVGLAKSRTGSVCTMKEDSGSRCRCRESQRCRSLKFSRKARLAAAVAS